CCYRQQFPGLVWFVMGLGAGAEEAADAAQSAFAAAFPAWETIRHPQAWLRRVAGRAYFRRAASREIPVAAAPDAPGPQLVPEDVEFRDEARRVLAALAVLPPRQRQMMAWHMDGFGPAEIARELGCDQAAVRGRGRHQGDARSTSRRSAPNASASRISVFSVGFADPRSIRLISP
ncbi:MAG: sigma-70 family RNA polymerase sigma factor, partial [Actinobacteria bacterium]|nr:sigma-70 family RNA polymerase sigma factor [Actinomycetota bacterium]